MGGTLTLAGMAAGLPSGEQILGPSTMTGVSPVGFLETTTLGSGDNVFALPAGVTCTAAAIFLGVGGVSATVKVRTNLDSGDAGLQVAPFSNVGFAVFPLPLGTMSVILNASATVASVAVAFI